MNKKDNKFKYKIHFLKAFLQKKEKNKNKYKINKISKKEYLGIDIKVEYLCLRIVNTIKIIKIIFIITNY